MTTSSWGGSSRSAGHSCRPLHTTAMPSPYEWNRYSPAIASAYAAIVRSYPAKAATSMRSDERG